jgi:methylphosphotriester-DNA--protein-cysteine methyltransferase
MTLSRHQTIQRARNAAALLMDGHSLLDTTFGAGYFDQAHLTRSLRGLVGITPARLARERSQLSFSYKTAAF